VIFFFKAFVFFSPSTNVFGKMCFLLCTIVTPGFQRFQGYHGAKLVRVMWDGLTTKYQGGSIWSILKCFFFVSLMFRG
jgi:hypothetical protein